MGFLTQGKCELYPDGARGEYVSDFSGGLNTSVTPTKLNKNFSPSMLNVYIDEIPGKLAKRGGTDTVISTAGMSTIVFSRRYVDSLGNEHLILSDNNKVVQTDDFQNFTTIKTDLTSAADLDGVQVNNEFWFSNGSNAVFKWDNSTMTILDGTNGTPNVPKGKYIEYFQNRVWLFNTSIDASEVRFSALTSTDGFIVSPSSANAWPAINQFYVQRGDGQVGTGMKEDWGILSFFKEASVHKLLGDDEFTYRPYKITEDAGTVSDKTIVFLDGYEIFLGKKGIYRYNGNNVERISDAIQPDIYNFYRTVVRTGNVQWDSLNFNANYGLSKNVAINEFGEVVIDTGVFTQPRSLESFDPSLDPLIPFEPEADGLERTGVTDKATYFPQQNITGYISKLMFTRIGGNCDTDWTYNVYTGNGDVYSTTTSFSTPKGDPKTFVQINYSPNEIVFSTQTTGIYFHWKINNRTNCTGSNTRAIQIGQPDKDLTGVEKSGAFEFVPNVFTFESVIATAAPITRWNAFNSERNSNGGSISYAYRTSTVSANFIATQPYISIIPGATIDSAVTSTTTYIQWIATFTPNAGNLQYILNAQADYTKSGANSDKAVATRWNNRYLLSVTTDSNSTNRLIYVKAKNTNANPIAFMKFQGIDATSFVEFNNFLYAGIKASTGCLKQLEVGDEDDGQAVNAFYETPDLVLGDQFFKKEILGVLVDIDRESSALLNLQTSVDGSDFTSSTRTISGTGRGIISLNNVGGRAVNSYKVRVENADIDKDMRLSGIAVIYKPTFIQGGSDGN